VIAFCLCQQASVVSTIGSKLSAKRLDKNRTTRSNFLKNSAWLDEKIIASATPKKDSD